MHILIIAYAINDLINKIPSQSYIYIFAFIVTVKLSDDNTSATVT